MLSSVNRSKFEPIPGGMNLGTLDTDKQQQLHSESVYSLFPPLLMESDMSVPGFDQH